MNKQLNNISGFFKIKPHQILFLALLLLPYLCASQTKKTTEVSSLLNPPSLLAQKAYLQTDKPSYMLGDTLWFKSYVWNANYLNNSLAKEILYIDIVNEAGTLMKRQMVALYYGMGIGNINLTESIYKAGNYRLRAYTNWMKNFDSQNLFERSFAIADPTENEWLVNSKMEVQREGNAKMLNANLLLSETKGNRIGQKEIEVSLFNGEKLRKKTILQTDAIGRLDFKFPLLESDKAKNLKIQLKTNGNSAQEIKFPVILKQAKDIDLQFLPESGNLVEGLKSKIGFKAIDENGYGTEVLGTVYNNLKQAVAHFKSTHLGMGSFTFTPKAGETYTATVKQQDGASQNYPLPIAKKSGIILNIVNNQLSDSLLIQVYATVDKRGGKYFFIGQARSVGCYGGIVNIADSVVKIKIGKNLFPSGVIKLILLDEQKQAVCERLVFNLNTDLLQVKLQPNKATYYNRDSVGLDVHISDEKGNPVQGSFSLAVTDDGQVKIDSVKNGNLLSHILLNSELKGFVEDPGYYFPKQMTAQIWSDLDQLLLTQGWTSYNWNAKYSAVEPRFKHESAYAVSGSVSSGLGKAIGNANVMLLSKNPSLLLQTTTNAKGAFAFNEVKLADSAVYFIQAKNKNNKSFNVAIKVDEFVAPKFDTVIQVPRPWFLNIDTGALGTVKNRVENIQQQNRLNGKKLNEVLIVGKKIVKGSSNLNNGNADLTLNESDLNKAGKKTLGQLLFENIPDLRVDEGRHTYMIRDQFVHLVIDGIDVRRMRPEGLSYRDFLRDSYLDLMTAEDIKGIELMRSPGMIVNYGKRFLNADKDIFDNHAFIEITTYSGNGAYITKTPGTYLFKPLSMVESHQFYSPKYKVKGKEISVDARSTVYWNPNVVTDKNGLAHVSFYTTDKKGSYTLILEGSNMNGGIGSAQSSIIVK